MNRLLLVIDVQNGFINEYTIKIVDKLKKLINDNKYEFVAFTKFINNKDSVFYNKLNYRGCTTKKEQEIIIITDGYKVFEKSTYTVVNNEFKKYIKDNNIDEIYICGFDTNACVFKTAIDLFELEYNVYVLKDYCMSYDGEDVHNYAIDSLKKLIGIDSIR